MGIPVPDTGSVTEDTDVDAFGFLNASGDINYLFGADNDEWTAETIFGAYGGVLTIDDDGLWTYSISNSNPNVEALNDGETLTEVFNVTSDAGPSTITITINGSTDPPCFVKGTLIDTPAGPRPVEDLMPGDLVNTRDNGAMPVRWSGGTELQLITKEDLKRYQPIRIRAGAIAPGIPKRDLLVSPLHKVLVTHSDLALLFGDKQIFCSARSLLNNTTITREKTNHVTYHHILFDSHQIITSNGCASESFFPGTVALDSLAHPQRHELFSLFPDLSSLPRSYGDTARMVLRDYETNLIRHHLLPVTAKTNRNP